MFFFKLINVIIRCYTKVVNFSDRGSDYNCENLYNLYKSFIKDCINESINAIKKTNIKDQDFINLFFKQ